MSKKLPTSAQCETVSGILKTMSHPQRLMILCHLTDGEKTVGELERLIGASQSAVSQFLARMKAEGLVSASRNSQHIHYDIKDANVKKLIQSLYRIYCE